jgi:hypothetical protein
MTVGEASTRIRDMASMIIELEPKLIEFAARTLFYLEKLTAFLDPTEPLSPDGERYMEEMDGAFDILLGSIARANGGAA